MTCAIKSVTARACKLTSRTSALQLFQNRFVDFAKGVTFLIIAEIQLVNDVDDLTEQNAVFHVVVGIGEGGAQWPLMG